MNWIFVGFLLPTLALYVHYSRREGNYLNALTGVTLLKCSTEFALEPIAYNLEIFDYRADTFFQLYLLSFTAYTALVLGARRTGHQSHTVAPPILVPTIMPWTFLVLSFLLYLPIFIEFRDSLFEPRYIYEQTRTGYGVQFFGSALLANFSLILFLLSKRRFHLLFLGLLICFTLLKGSKGQILTEILIYAIWVAYVLRLRFDIKRTLAGVAVVSTILAGLFALNFRGDTNSLVLMVASYSDYNRHASLILENPNSEIYYGRLTLENFVYSKIPRALWPDKPKNFGAFLLADTYFPQLFELDQGAPSFGIGIYFADFRMLAFLFIAGAYFFTGRMLRYFVKSCERRASVFSFIMVLFFADVTLLPAGVGYFLVEHLVLAAVLHKLVLAFGNRPRVIVRPINTTGCNA
jgi:hypothetical protein